MTKVHVYPRNSKSTVDAQCLIKHIRDFGDDALLSTLIFNLKITPDGENDITIETPNKNGEVMKIKKLADEFNDLYYGSRYLDDGKEGSQ